MYVKLPSTNCIKFVININILSLRIKLVYIYILRQKRISFSFINNNTSDIGFVKMYTAVAVDCHTCKSYSLSHIYLESPNYNIVSYTRYHTWPLNTNNAKTRLCPSMSHYSDSSRPQLKIKRNSLLYIKRYIR